MTKDSSPTISIVIVAGFQIFVSVLLLSVFVDGARRIYFSDHFSHASEEFLHLGILLGSGLLGIVAAMGLMRLKNWARSPHKA